MYYRFILLLATVFGWSFGYLNNNLDLTLNTSVFSDSFSLQPRRLFIDRFSIYEQRKFEEKKHALLFGKKNVISNNSSKILLNHISKLISNLQNENIILHSNSLLIPYSDPIFKNTKSINLFFHGLNKSSNTYSFFHSLNKKLTPKDGLKITKITQFNLTTFPQYCSFFYFPREERNIFFKKKFKTKVFSVIEDKKLSLLKKKNITEKKLFSPVYLELNKNQKNAIEAFVSWKKTNNNLRLLPKQVISIHNFNKLFAYKESFLSWSKKNSFIDRKLKKLIVSKKRLHFWKQNDNKLKNKIIIATCQQLHFPIFVSSEQSFLLASGASVALNIKCHEKKTFSAYDNFNFNFRVFPCQNLQVVSFNQPYKETQFTNQSAKTNKLKFASLFYNARQQSLSVLEAPFGTERDLGIIEKNFERINHASFFDVKNTKMAKKMNFLKSNLPSSPSRPKYSFFRLSFSVPEKYRWARKNNILSVPYQMLIKEKNYSLQKLPKTFFARSTKKLVSNCFTLNKLPLIISWYDDPIFFFDSFLNVLRSRHVKTLVEKEIWNSKKKNDLKQILFKHHSFNKAMISFQANKFLKKWILINYKKFYFYFYTVQNNNKYLVPKFDFSFCLKKPSFNFYFLEIYAHATCLNKTCPTLLAWKQKKIHNYQYKSKVTLNYSYSNSILAESKLNSENLQYDKWTQKWLSHRFFTSFFPINLKIYRKIPNFAKFIFPSAFSRYPFHTERMNFFPPGKKEYPLGISNGTIWEKEIGETSEKKNKIESVSPFHMKYGTDKMRNGWKKFGKKKITPLKEHVSFAFNPFKYQDIINFKNHKGKNAVLCYTFLDYSKKVFFTNLQANLFHFPLTSSFDFMFFPSERAKAAQRHVFFSISSKKKTWRSAKAFSIFFPSSSEYFSPTFSFYVPSDFLSLLERNIFKKGSNIENTKKKAFAPVFFSQSKKSEEREKKINKQSLLLKFEKFKLNILTGKQKATINQNLFFKKYFYFSSFFQNIDFLSIIKSNSYNNSLLIQELESISSRFILNKENFKEKKQVNTNLKKSFRGAPCFFFRFHRKKNMALCCFRSRFSLPNYFWNRNRLKEIGRKTRTFTVAEKKIQQLNKYKKLLLANTEHFNVIDKIPEQPFFKQMFILEQNFLFSSKRNLPYKFFLSLVPHSVTASHSSIRKLLWKNAELKKKRTNNQHYSLLKEKNTCAPFVSKEGEIQSSKFLTEKSLKQLCLANEFFSNFQANANLLYSKKRQNKKSESFVQNEKISFRNPYSILNLFTNSYLINYQNFLCRIKMNLNTTDAKYAISLDRSNIDPKIYPSLSLRKRLFPFRKKILEKKQKEIVNDFSNNYEIKEFSSFFPSTLFCFGKEKNKEKTPGKQFSYFLSSSFFFSPLCKATSVFSQTFNIALRKRRSFWNFIPASQRKTEQKKAIFLDQSKISPLVWERSDKENGKAYERGWDFFGRSISQITSVPKSFITHANHRLSSFPLQKSESIRISYGTDKSFSPWEKGISFRYFGQNNLKTTLQKTITRVAFDKKTKLSFPWKSTIKKFKFYFNNRKNHHWQVTSLKQYCINKFGDSLLKKRITKENYVLWNKLEKKSKFSLPFCSFSNISLPNGGSFQNRESYGKKVFASSDKKKNKWKISQFSASNNFFNSNVVFSRNNLHDHENNLIIPMNFSQIRSPVKLLTVYCQRPTPKFKDRKGSKFLRFNVKPKSITDTLITSNYQKPLEFMNQNKSFLFYHFIVKSFLTYNSLCCVQILLIKVIPFLYFSVIENSFFSTRISLVSQKLKKNYKLFLLTINENESLEQYLINDELSNKQTFKPYRSKITEKLF